jgi:hypothetical protein
VVDHRLAVEVRTPVVLPFGVEAGLRQKEFWRDRPELPAVAPAATGTLATQVTDQPGDIADFESCIVTIEGIWLKPIDGTETESATMTDGEAEVDTPGNALLQFTRQLEVREGQRTVFTGDFTPVKRGQTSRYLLQPVASGTEVSYETVETTTQG